MSLLRDIYFTIGLFLPSEAQPKYHQVCKTFREFPIDFEQYCVPPSKFEIPEILQSTTAEFLFTSSSCYRKYLYLEYTTKPIYGYTPTVSQNDPKVSKKVLINTKDELLSFLQDATLILNFEPFIDTTTNWLLTRRILSTRTSCISTGMVKDSKRIFSTDFCYIELLTKGSPLFEWDNSVDCLHYLSTLVELINSSTQKQFEKEISQALKLPFTFNLSNPEAADYFHPQWVVPIDIQYLTDWLRNWIAQLQPTDLANNLIK